MTVRTKEQTSELRELARVIRSMIGVISKHWDFQGLAPGHPYRHAASMLDCFLKKRYDV